MVLNIMQNEKRLNYKVLNPIGFGGERCPRGSVVKMYPTEAKAIGTDYVELIDDEVLESESVTTDDSNVEDKEVVKPVSSKKAKKK